jgi:hypothetical protein
MSALGKYLRQCSDDTLIAWCPGCKTNHPFDLKRWTFNNNPDRPTFSPSLLCNANINNDAERCHSFVTDGNWIFLSDCWHELKDQTIPMVAINEDWEPETKL